jgi:hypothetical protein
MLRPLQQRLARIRNRETRDRFRGGDRRNRREPRREDSGDRESVPRAERK